jgi:hypothetical protein
MTDSVEAKRKEKKREMLSEAKMTYLLSYETPRGQEIRVHDAEFRGQHYFDFRFYEKGTQGSVPTRRGIRLGLRDVGHLEDAVSKWRSFLERLEPKDSVQDPFKKTSSDREEEG